jgi:DNA-binding CsgD family transcriptional regulator/tetratricopeptide (TPR) repeat protein
LAERAVPELFGVTAITWLDRLEGDHDNLRAALRWALDHAQAELALRLGGALWQFWWVRGYLGEGRRWLEHGLGLVGFRERGAAAEPRMAVLPGVLARALNGAGVLANYQGDYGRAATLCGESLSLSRRDGNLACVAAALNGLAAVARTGGDFATARAMYEEAISILQGLGDLPGLTVSLQYLGTLLWWQGDGEAARWPTERAMALARELGDKRHIAGALGTLANLRHEAGEFAAATELYQEALDLDTQIGSRRGVARAMWGLGRGAAGRGALPEAYAYFQEGGTLFRELGDRLSLCQCIDGLAELALKLERPHLAARLLGAAASMFSVIGTARRTPAHREHARIEALARVALGDAAFATSFASGQALTLERAIAAATDLRDALPMGQPATPRPADDDGDSPLSAREWQVVRLIARGRTNKQIAAELVIAEGTADRHVSNILSKLGFSARAQVAAWAVAERGQSVVEPEAVCSWT